MRRTLSRLWWTLIVALVLLPYVALLAPPANAITSSVPASWAGLAKSWSGLTQLTGAGSATDDDLLVYDTSATTLKRIARSELASVVGSTSAGATAYRTTDVSVTTTPTAVTLDAEVTDTGSIHDNSTNTSRLTVPTTRVYLATISGGGYYSVGAYLDIKLYKNGSAITGCHAVKVSTTGYDGPAASWVVSLTANDYLEAYVYTNSGTGTWSSDGSATGGRIAFSVAGI